MKSDFGTELTDARVMELEESRNITPSVDPRPRMPEPPPVKLVTIDDARLLASTGLERDLDAFYVGILQFERDPKADGIAYRAENFRIWIDQVEGAPIREGMRPLGIEVRSLDAAMTKLQDAKIPYDL